MGLPQALGDYLWWHEVEGFVATGFLDPGKAE